jgi:hypothetical protein
MIEYNFINNCGDIESWALINFKDRYNDYRTTGDFYYWGLVLNEPLPIIEKYLKEIFKFDELPISKTGKNCLSGAL